MARLNELFGILDVFFYSVSPITAVLLSYLGTSIKQLQ